MQEEIIGKMDNVFFLKDFQIEPNEEISIIESKSGYLVPKFKGYYLHSKYDPIREAKQLAENYYNKNHAHVLFGIGFAYLAKEILERMDETDFLLIIEPSARLFNEVKSKGLLGPLINHSQVFIVVGYEETQVEEEIKYLVSSKYMAQVEVIISPNYDRLYSSTINELHNIIKRNVKLSVVNLGTITVFSKIWQENLLHNLFGSWKSIPFESYKNRFDCPVIIASSGPSLTKQLDLLKIVKERQSALIIAAGSTINPLLKSGIKPHLVVSIDGGEANWTHFNDLNNDDIPLFYSLAVHKNIPKNHKGLKVVFNNDDKALETWVDKTVGKKLGMVVGGASVANFCFYIAKMISTGPITFIGQDLAYTNNYTHAAGNKYTKGLSEEDYQDKNKYVTVKGYYGNDVFSDYKFLSMKRTFEDMVRLFRKYGDERPICNSTEGGVYLEGIANLPFEDFVSTYCNTYYGSEFEQSFMICDSNHEQKEHILSSLEEEKENLLEVIRLAKRALNTLKGVSKEQVVIDNKILKKLDKLDNKLDEYLKSNIVHYIIMPITFRINHIYQEKQNETPLEQTKRILNKSEALYNGILEATETTLNILEDILREG